jgi:hypothetical protein
LLTRLKDVRDEIAAKLKMDPSLLATKSTLTAVALTGCHSRQKMIDAADWMKWQEALLLDAWLKPQDKKPEEKKSEEKKADEKKPEEKPPEEKKKEQWGR